MNPFIVQGQLIELPAFQLSKKAFTNDESAWLCGVYITVKLLSPITMLRIHTGGIEYPGRKASKELGRWLLVGDIIQTASEISNTRALPTNNPSSMISFTRVSNALLSTNTVLNIGVAAQKFGGSGGGAQAEYVSGPPIRFEPLTGKIWHSQAGSA